MNRALLLVLLAAALAGLGIADTAAAHISNDPSAGSCPDDGREHVHVKWLPCFSIPTGNPPVS